MTSAGTCRQCLKLPGQTEVPAKDKPGIREIGRVSWMSSVRCSGTRSLLPFVAVCDLILDLSWLALCHGAGSAMVLNDAAAWRSGGHTWAELWYLADRQPDIQHYTAECAHGLTSDPTTGAMYWAHPVTPPPSLRLRDSS